MESNPYVVIDLEDPKTAFSDGLQARLNELHAQGYAIAHVIPLPNRAEDAFIILERRQP